MLFGKIRPGQAKWARTRYIKARKMGIVMLYTTERIDFLSGRVSAWVADLDTELMFISVLLIAVTVLLRRPLASLFTTIIAKLLATIGITPTEDMLAEIKGSVSIVLVTAALLVALKIMSPPAIMDGVAQKILVTVIVLTFYRSLYRRVDLIVVVIAPTGVSRVGAGTAWMVSLLRMAVAVMAFATTLEVWGVSISGALTGVGVFGAGVAIAAQDFVSNFIAGLNNVSERRFLPGDWIKVGNDLEGTVARMDLRSTTVMGFDRVPRYVPNSALANAVLLNYDRMDHRQISWTFGLKFGATDEQIESVCDDLRRHVEESGDYVTDGTLLCFIVPSGLSESAVEIMIYVFAKTASYQPYLEVCGRLTMALRAAVTRAGTELAYPTRTVILENANASAATEPAPAEQTNVG